MWHVRYLSTGRFDYSYNMLACTVFGVTHNIIWLVWAFLNRTAPHSNTILLCILWITAAMSLEVFDFPPVWDIFDAHSLWHGATVFLVPLWYDCYILDAQWLQRHTLKLKQ
jgi:hypothetical protein